jgi:esterase/lipase
MSLDITTHTRIKSEQNKFMKGKDTYKDPISSCTIREIILMTDFIKNNMEEIKGILNYYLVPTFIQFGRLDKVCEFEGFELLYYKIKTDDKKIKKYESYHSLSKI